MTPSYMIFSLDLSLFFFFKITKLFDDQCYYEYIVLAILYEKGRRSGINGTGRHTLPLYINKYSTCVCVLQYSVVF